MPVGKSCTVAVKAIPNAPYSEIVGWLGEVLRVKLHAPALEGRANEALCELLAEHLDLPRSAVRLLRGETSRQKIVRIQAVTLEELSSRFPRPCNSRPR